MFVLVVLYVLVMFLYYISIYLGSTRVLALRSQVLLLPPENYEGENFFESQSRTNLFNVCILTRVHGFPRSILKTTNMGT